MRFRKERVAGAIHEIVSDAISRKINDPRLAPLTTVSRVVVSGDLMVATVYLTVVGGETLERRSLAAMQHARGFVQRLVAQQIDLRQCPEIRFELDEVAKKVRETMLLLDENRRLEPHLFADSSPDVPAQTSENPSSSTAQQAIEDVEETDS
jgi:ribosome-binding factor A